MVVWSCNNEHVWLYVFIDILCFYYWIKTYSQGPLIWCSINKNLIFLILSWKERNLYWLSLLNEPNIINVFSYYSCTSLETHWQQKHDQRRYLYKTMFETQLQSFPPKLRFLLSNSKMNISDRNLPPNTTAWSLTVLVHDHPLSTIFNIIFLAFHRTRIWFNPSWCQRQEIFFIVFTLFGFSSRLQVCFVAP